MCHRLQRRGSAEYGSRINRSNTSLEMFSLGYMKGFKKRWSRWHNAHSDLDSIHVGQRLDSALKMRNQCMRIDSARIIQSYDHMITLYEKHDAPLCRQNFCVEEISRYIPSQYNVMFIWISASSGKEWSYPPNYLSYRDRKILQWTGKCLWFLSFSSSFTWSYVELMTYLTMKVFS